MHIRRWLTLLCLGVVAAHAETIFTVAGGEVSGYGDGGPATSAVFGGIAAAAAGGIAVDTGGNLFVLDADIHRARRVDAASGVITTVAGSGRRGLSGDGGAAVNADMWPTGGLAVDTGANLFIADTLNGRIRKVDVSTGVITTVAGGHMPYGSSEGDGGPATNAYLYYPSAVAVDAAGNLFIAERERARIRKVSAATGIITTYAGTGTPGFSGDGGPASQAELNLPSTVALDAAGNLFVADTQNARIRRIDAATQVITTVAGNGSQVEGPDGGIATSSGIGQPYWVAVDSAGSIFITQASSVRKVDASTGVITTAVGDGVAGFSGDGGPASVARLSRPGALAFDAAGNLLVMDAGNRRVRRVLAATAVIDTVAGGGPTPYNGDGGSATSARLFGARSATRDVAGNVVIAQFQTGGLVAPGTYDPRVRRVSPAGLIETWAGDGMAGYSGDNGPGSAARLGAPSSVASDAAGNVFVADMVNHAVRRIDAAGVITTVAGNGSSGFGGDGGLAIGAQLDSPNKVALDAAGNLYILDAGNLRVRKVTAATGVIETIAGNGSSTPWGADGVLATSGGIGEASSFALDAGGNLFIAHPDPGATGRVRKVDAATQLVSTVGTLGPNGASNPNWTTLRATAIDGSGRVLLVDPLPARSCVRRLDPATQAITAFVGDCSGGGFAGDGGPPAAAQLSAPWDVTADAAGNVYIADAGNGRVRVVTSEPAFGLTVAKTGSGSGSVVSTLSASPSIDCGPTCTALYLRGTPVTLVAAPAGDSTFSGWGGACAGTGTCEITMDQARNVTAAFDPRPGFALAATQVALTGTTTGTVTYSASGEPAFNCATAECARTYAPGTIVTLSAAPAPGPSIFVGWSGACSGTGACQVTMDGPKAVTARFGNPTRLVNISTRAMVQTGDNVLIAGFIIGGSSPKKVVVRARGPSLSQAGVPGVLADPQLQLFSGQTSIGFNDDWQSSNVTALHESGFTPDGLAEAAIVATLNPGAYTAVVTGKGGTSGVAIVEVFEVDAVDVPLTNISTRGRVLAGDSVMIAGFIVQGSSPQTVVVRARGPSLAQAGVPGVLVDPVLELFSGQVSLRSNDDWQAGPDAAAIQASGFAPSDPREAAMQVTLQPGAYTAIVTGAGATTGVAIVEVFTN